MNARIAGGMLIALRTSINSSPFLVVVDAHYRGAQRGEGGWRHVNRKMRCRDQLKCAIRNSRPRTVNDPFPTERLDYRVLRGGNLVGVCHGEPADGSADPTASCCRQQR